MPAFVIGLAPLRLKSFWNELTDRYIPEAENSISNSSLGVSLVCISTEDAQEWRKSKVPTRKVPCGQRGECITFFLLCLLIPSSDPGGSSVFLCCLRWHEGALSVHNLWAHPHKSILMIGNLAFLRVTFLCGSQASFACCACMHGRPPNKQS